MSRAFNLSMSEAEVIKHCSDKSIAVSVIEALPEGGTRLVTMNGVTIKSKDSVASDPFERVPGQPVNIKIK